ncbi:hypothetical protein FISHEDRAFT_55830 [Fistulina hepatica ATCC 64428]|uniref:glucan endo-1,3-beta-D-glucosidase n=1 Tax=Fistulina hepatica ATCC 64428 TaxID=1128425 RepID=A0A0D7AMR5_9AGAR|nr:hypothetical protein FISHEDRAFT_55830 [Fistulina hepatica ATCC 64428]
MAKSARRQPQAWKLKWPISISGSALQSRWCDQQFQLSRILTSDKNSRMAPKETSHQSSLNDGKSRWELEVLESNPLSVSEEGSPNISYQSLTTYLFESIGTSLMDAESTWVTLSADDKRDVAGLSEKMGQLSVDSDVASQPEEATPLESMSDDLRAALEHQRSYQRTPLNDLDSFFRLHTWVAAFNQYIDTTDPTDTERHVRDDADVESRSADVRDYKPSTKRHSWASGIANGAGSRNQESSGEAINGYYGSLLWANVTGNSDIVDYTRLLLATEQHGAQVYWHPYPEANGSACDQPDPEQDVHNLVTMGNAEDWQAASNGRFWGDEQIEIAAVQMLPVKPVNKFRNTSTTWLGRRTSTPNLSEATTMSSSLTTWDPGNSYGNQVPRHARGDISAAAVFNLSFAPNMGATYALENDQYVTADDTGTYALSAARSVASMWELYMIRQQDSAESGVDTILAKPNSAYLIVESDRAVVNNVTNVTSAEGFRLIRVWFRFSKETIARGDLETKATEHDVNLTENR